MTGQNMYAYLQRLGHMMSHGEFLPPGYLTQPRRRSARLSSRHDYPSGSSDSSSRRTRFIPPDYPDTMVPTTSGFRRNIYTNNLWVRRVPDLTGRFRECSAEFFA